MQRGGPVVSSPAVIGTPWERLAARFRRAHGGCPGWLLAYP